MNVRDADHMPSSADALVAELWRRDPPGGHDAANEDPEACVVALQRTLAAVAADAARTADDCPPAERAGARLLSETATAMHDTLGTLLSAVRGVAKADSVTPWMDRIRFARMERWLAARAESDPAAEPAANLCLWVIEHLEMAVPLPRRITPLGELPDLSTER